MTFSRKSVYLVLALASLSAAKAPAQQPAPFDPKTAVTEAIHRLEEADRDSRRFTYFKKITMANLTPRGRIVDVTNRKYEVTYINDLPYMRLLEVDDKPLTGNDLKDEQKRYDKAIAKKHVLDDKKRSSTDNFIVIKPDFELPLLLTDAYTLKEISTEATADGDTLQLIDASLNPAVKRKSKCPWHVRLWISDKTGLLMHYVTDVAGDTSPFCTNSTEEERFLVIDGLPKTSKHAGRMNRQDERGDGYFTYEFLDADTDYRRFHATVTLGAATEVPDENPPAPPPETPPAK